MAYAEGREFFDADSHIMELPGWLSAYADPAVRDRLPGFSLGTSGSSDRVEEMIARGKSRAGVAAERAEHEAELMLRKGWDAYGAFHADDRRRALDLLGFRAQLVFSTFGSHQVEISDDPDVAYGAARALTRGIVEFCAGDARLLPVTFVPLTLPERALAETRFALDHGVKGVTVSPLPPESHSITHPALHPVYALLEERGVPLFFHVEGHAPRKVASGFSKNGWDGQTDFHGGGENFTGLTYMAVSQWTEIALAALIFDRVLEKFPKLKVGVIELGAVWLPAWLERLEIVKDTFGRTESRIGGLPLRPTEYAKRQIRVTPYPTEDVGRLIERCGPEMLLFSSDFPHVEGGRNPLKRFETSLAGRGERDKDAFYARNFLESDGLFVLLKHAPSMDRSTLLTSPLTAADFALRLAFFALAPVAIVRIAELFPVRGALIDVGLALGVFVVGETARRAASRFRAANYLLSQALAFESFYRKDPPRPFAYYLFYPLLFPYWLANSRARREFLMFRGYTLGSLLVLLVSLAVQYFEYWQPDLGFGQFLRSIVFTLIVETVLVLSLLMPIATTVVWYHSSYRRGRLLVLLVAGLVSASVALAYVARKRDPIVSYATRDRVRLRTKAEPLKARQAQLAAVRAACAEATRDGADGDGKIEGVPLETAHEKLEKFYKHDEAYSFDLWGTPRKKPRIIVLYFEARQGKPPIWVAVHNNGTELGTLEELPPGATRSMRRAADGMESLVPQWLTGVSHAKN